MSSTTTPLSLLVRLRQPDDDDAWSRLLKVYRPMIQRSLAYGGLSGHDLEDLSQDVMLTLVREIPGFRHSGRRGAFRVWLRRVVTNRILGYRRMRATRRETIQQVEFVLNSLEDPSSDLARLWGKQHDQYVIEQLLALLRAEFTRTTWEAFCRQAMNGCVASEVAEELGVSVNAVLISKSRVLRRLRQEAAGLVD